MRRFLVLLVSVLSFALPAQDKAAVDAAMSTGQKAIEAGDFAAAAKAFKTATDLDPANGRGWQLLGYSLHADKRLDEALPVHLKAAEFKDVAPVALYNAACVYSLKGERDKAIEYLQKAVASGFNDQDQLAGDSDFDGMRDDPRLVKLAETLASGVQVFSPTTNRHSARLAYFTRHGSPGQIAIDYAVLPWQDQFEQTLKSPKFTGKRWRLGADFWTTMDNSMPLRIGGVVIPAGYWYLTLERRGDDFVLGVHDPVAVKKQHIDPYRADLVRDGIEVPLQHTVADKVHPQLEIAITLPPGEQHQGEFRVGFGGHELTAKVAIDLADAASR